VSYAVKGDEDAAACVDCFPYTQHSQSRCSRLRVLQVDRRSVVCARSSPSARSEDHTTFLLRQLRHQLPAVQCVGQGVPTRLLPARLVHGAADDALGEADATSRQVFDAAGARRSKHRRRPADAAACPVQFRRTVQRRSIRLAVQLVLPRCSEPFQ